jgi:hypothetical protein
MRNMRCELAIMPKFVNEGEIALATPFIDLETEDLNIMREQKIDYR